MSEKLKKLVERKTRIAAEIQRIRGRETEAERKAETRRKIIVGGLVLGMVERGEMVDKNSLLAALDKSLSRPPDRALFNLSHRLPATPDRG